MTAAHSTGFRWEMTDPGAPLVRTEFDLPRPEVGQALVRVAGCGVCHTDLGFLFDGVRPRHPLPLALGHEVSGVVEAVGEGSPVSAGQAVIVPAVTPCGECTECRAGRGPTCPAQVMPGNDVQGGFASHLLVPARGLCPVPGEGAAEGALLGRSGCTLAELSVIADAVTTPYQAVRRAEVGARDLAIVVGLGGVGGYCAQIAHAEGAVVVGIEPDATRREGLADHGLDLAIDPGAEDARSLRKRVRAFAAEQGLGSSGWRIFECSGHPAGQSTAWSLLGPDAHLSVIGFTRNAIELRLANLMAFDATARGNWGCLPELYPQALQLVLDGRVAVAPFVETFPLAEVQSVLERVRDHQITTRPVLIP
ncbi:MAG: 6-hydroxycyclohex-1-ene-1-carbonyl-CoA dehydrogenase [Planctomycetota bacterium]|jgi:6-hydroxycyclohex-1-ene-1-carbonyl-CoA dehydrogenase|nr:6-hydroxycyclohex-1-ene-1-carbonyl-CoA dehydrogenase [Planctomycetota bacterium]MDP6762363.1 6-hydroxycyclohex-1-ene-1-carbonyl-CoA dehydrogenase [Planctomycetota bacterium]MDP6990020.1 6-hydroxycyclohex-1-ene-1-carbonyl-CoA dehydrogenase [Planctomycetota bacterium]